MAYEYDTRGVLLEWMKEGDNKLCVECNTPHPQWCSLSLAVSLCLQCSGTHRSLGSHLSFVRSLTMDKWTTAQIDRMKAGGNAKCKEFFEANGQPFASLPITEKYNTHIASMYREKLVCDAEGRPWVPSAPDPASTSATSNGGAGASTTGSLRKPRASNLASSGASSSSSGPNSRSGSPAVGGLPSRAQNEDFFARMGAANDSRPDHLPPSQGGKYGGFGSGGAGTSSASRGGGNNHNNPLSSRNLPGIDDLRDDPMGALNKGWGFLGAALGAVGKTVNESVLQPTLERATDPALQTQFSALSSRAKDTLTGAARVGGQVLSTGLEQGSTILRRDLGVNVGDLGASYLDRATGRGAGQGYGNVGEDHAPSAHSALEPGRGDFFDEHMAGAGGDDNNNKASDRDLGGFRDMPTTGAGAGARSSATPSPAPSSTSATAAAAAATTSGPARSLSPPPAAPVIDASWDSLAPQAAARRAQQEKAAPAPKKTAEEEEWESW
ncbi:hypothetical protein JCM3774_000236 [Rhodotorula dairenensis]